ncbi:MAG TPA: hypothetical protein VFX16_11410 [Pseudonocardiaceae bacterium]|nr:hypothetical protein [Pseudonocardiaceae bacterium]
MATGRTMGYLDLRQVGFRGRPTEVGHRVRAANVAAVWRSYRDRGAAGLVVAGEIDADAVEHYRSALPAATLTVCRLHADKPDLTARIMPRGQHMSWAQPGDQLFGRSAGELSQVVDSSVAQQEVLDRAGVGVRVDSTGLDVAGTADAILATGVRLGPSPAPQHRSRSRIPGPSAVAARGRP